MTSQAHSDQSDAFGLSRLLHRYHKTTHALETATQGWFVSLTARFAFAALLLPYYFNSALTKFDAGFLGLFPPSAGAFAQILPPIAEQYTYNVDAIPFFPWHLVVIAGSLAEIVLPVLIVIGLFSRLSALGMIGFVLVQTVIDVAFHDVALGGLFNAQPGQLVDQRLLWAFLLLIVVVKGGGKVSLDRLLARLAGRS